MAQEAHVDSAPALASGFMGPGFIVDPQVLSSLASGLADECTILLEKRGSSSSSVRSNVTGAMNPGNEDTRG